MSSYIGSLIVMLGTLLTVPLEAASEAAPTCIPSLAPRASGPQVADEDFAPAVSAPAFAPGSGPTVLLDEAHHNFHTAGRRYAPFAKLLRSDGFAVEPSPDAFTATSLARADVLVIANALAERNRSDWTLPTPSAFGSDEIEAVRGWVSEGGALLLIADHMPFPGAAAQMARAFGILFTNGYATDASCSEDEFLFQRSDGSLTDHPITRGRNDDERVDAVRTITGQAFRVIGQVDPLLRLAPGSVVLLPSKAWDFSETTPQVPGDGLLQGAVLDHGRGRVAVFGEAAMFTAQVSGAERRPMGMNMPRARENPQFLLNVMPWLVRLIR